MMAEGFDFSVLTGYLPLLFLAVVGLLLCYAGLSVFKSLQFIICAAVGLSIGLCIQSLTGREELYYVAGLLALLAGWIGYRHYRVALYLAAAFCSQLAVVIYFIKRAYETIRGSVASIPDMRTLVDLWWEQVARRGDVEAATREVIGEQTAVVLEQIRQALHILQQGLVLATAVGLIVGVLALLLGDYIIILFTALLGAALLVSVADHFFALEQQVYLLVALVFAGSGIALQCMGKWRGGGRRRRG